MTDYQAKQKGKRAFGYSAYFEGYSEAKVPKKHGKGYKVVRIYTDNYYLHEMDDNHWKILKLLMGILMLISFALFLWSAYDRTGSNSAVYVVVPCGLSLFCELFLFVHTVEYVCEPRRMTDYGYKNSHKSIMRWAMLSTFGLAAVCLATLIYLLIVRTQPIRLLWCALRFLLAALASGTIYFMESKVSYCEEENDTKLPFYEDAPF